MSKKALKLQTNGNKTYKVVSADQLSRMVIEDYSPRFVQLYDEDGVNIDVDTFENGKTYSIEEIEMYGWTTNPCAWYPPTTYTRKGREGTVSKSAYFTTGAAEGTGSIKNLLQSSPRVPNSLQKDVKTFFSLVEKGLDISAASDSLVGGIDALRGLTENTYYELQAVMLDYWQKCDGGNPRLDDEGRVELFQHLDQHVLKHTQIQRSLF